MIHYTMTRRKLERKASLGGWWDRAERAVRYLEDACWRVRGLQILECFGDSHAGVFRVLNDNPACQRVRFRAIPVNGATVFGLANPNSTTNALTIFRRWLVRLSPTRELVVLMGEVDMGFLVWWRAMKSAASPESIMVEVLTRYQSFLSEVRRWNPRIIVVSAPLPTIRDGQEFGEIANRRREIRASQLERTQLTVRFNACMAAWCATNGIRHINLDDRSLDPDTMLVRFTLLNTDPRNHHYNEIAFADLVAQAMAEEGILE